jgi:hypothetical protein
MGTLINSPQEFIKDVTLQALGTVPVVGVPWINVLGYCKIPKGQGYLLQRIFIGSPETVRIFIPGIIAIIAGSHRFTPGRHSGTQRRDLARCQITLDHWLPEDMPNLEEYRQNMEELEGLGAEIPAQLETIDDAKNLLMQSLYDRKTIVQSVREVGVSQREQSKGYLERATLEVIFLPSAPIEGLLS